MDVSISLVQSVLANQQNNICHLELNLIHRPIDFKKHKVPAVILEECGSSNIWTIQVSDRSERITDLLHTREVNITYFLVASRSQLRTSALKNAFVGPKFNDENYILSSDGNWYSCLVLVM